MQRDLSGVPLPFIAPYPTPRAFAVNIFAQKFGSDPVLVSNPFVFPPISRIPHFLRFLADSPATFTIIVPDVTPRRPWWPILVSCSSSSALLAKKGAVGVVLPPSKDDWLIPWDFRVFWV